MATVQDALTRMNSDTDRVNFERGRANLGSTKLDKQAFLQLLMTRLRYQDPLNPVKDEDFLAQQAQLAQVEKLDDLSKIMQSNSQLTQASSLVGKKVDVRESTVSGVNLTSTGIIDSVSLDNGTTGISINGKVYTPDQITKIYGSSH